MKLPLHFPYLVFALICIISFFFYPTIAMSANEKTNIIERFNHPETSLVYPMLLNSGKSPKQAKEEIRRGMLESDRIIAKVEKRENYLEGMQIERELSPEDFEKEIIEEEKYCNVFISYYNKPETSPSYKAYISLYKTKSKAIKEIKKYYIELTKEYFEDGYTWRNCLDYAKDNREDIINKMTTEDKIKIENHNNLVNNLLN